MNRIVSSLLLLLTIGCESWAPLESEYQGDNIWVELDPRLPEDNNGYYHLEINQDKENLETDYRSQE